MLNAIGSDASSKMLRLRLCSTLSKVDVEGVFASHERITYYTIAKSSSDAEFESKQAIARGSDQLVRVENMTPKQIQKKLAMDVDA